ncbi:MAG: hypothetical protein WCH84_10900, partial [Verrucomicrobiota bacterium]
MGDFTFSCPHCKQSLEASDEMRGQLVDCPTCKKPIEIPHSYPPIQQPKPVPPYITPIASGIFTRLLAWWLTRPIFVRTISAFGTLLFLVFSGFAFYEGYFGIGVLCLVAGGVNLLAAPLGWLIGDKFR